MDLYFLKKVWFSFLSAKFLKIALNQVLGSFSVKTESWILAEIGWKRKKLMTSIIVWKLYIFPRKIWFSNVTQKYSRPVRFAAHLCYYIFRIHFLHQFSFSHVVKHPWNVKAECVTLRVNHAVVLRHAWLNLNLPKFVLIQIHVSNESFCRM